MKRRTSANQSMGVSLTGGGPRNQPLEGRLSCITERCDGAKSPNRVAFAATNLLGICCCRGVRVLRFARFAGTRRPCATGLGPRPAPTFHFECAGRKISGEGPRYVT